MAKKSGTIDYKRLQNEPKRASREEIDAALARLQKIADEQPPVDAVKLVRKLRSAGADRLPKN